MHAKNFYFAIHSEATNMVSFPYQVDECGNQPKPEEFGGGLTEYVLRKKKYDNH